MILEAISMSSNLNACGHCVKMAEWKHFHSATSLFTLLSHDIDLVPLELQFWNHSRQNCNYEKTAQIWATHFQNSVNFVLKVLWVHSDLNWFCFYTVMFCCIMCLHFFLELTFMTVPRSFLFSFKKTSKYQEWKKCEKHILRFIPLDLCIIMMKKLLIANELLLRNVK